MRHDSHSMSHYIILYLPFLAACLRFSSSYSLWVHVYVWLEPQLQGPRVRQRHGLVFRGDRVFRRRFSLHPTDRPDPKRMTELEQTFSELH